MESSEMCNIMTRLRVLRAEKNVSQEFVAKAISVSHRAYNAIETGKSTPSLQTTVALAEYFNVSVDYLIGRKNER